MSVWLKRLSYLAILGFPLSVLGTRLGLFHFRVGFTGLSYTVYLSVAVLVVGLIVAYIKRSSNPSDSKMARNAALLCLLPILGIGSQLMTAQSVPAIHNITTDIDNPPLFATIAGLRTEEHNPLAYDKEKMAPLQQQAYPEVKTIVTTLSKKEAHDRAIAVAKELGWEIVDQNYFTGMIEATETTLLWGFKDDIAIRVDGHGKDIAVDLRSVSRVGQSDLGANAKRINKFIAAFNQD